MKDKFFLEKKQEIQMNVIKLQKSLDEKKRDYNEIVSSIPGGICKIICDHDLTIAYANAFYYHMFGYTEEEARSLGFKHLRFLTHEVDFQRVKQALQKCFAEHTYRLEIEVRQFHRSGETVWVLAKGVYQEGIPGGFTCVFIDITKQKKVEENLKISEEEYRIVVQRHTEKIIVRYDMNKKRLTHSKWAAEALEIPQVMENVPYSMVENGYISSESVDDYIEFYESIANCVPQGNCVFKLHNQHWYRADYTLMYNQAKKPIRAIISYEDVTEQRERAFAYEKWRQYNSSLKEKSIAYYEYNLTKDMVERLDASLASKIPHEVGKSFSAVVRYIADHFIYEVDREKYRRFFSRETLLTHYHMGKKELTFEYRRLQSTGKPYWVSTNSQLLPDPYSEDIKLLVLMQDIDAQKQEEDRLQKLSQTDSLTGLLNRRTVVDKIEVLLEQAGDDRQYAFIMIDIDYFKNLNDMLGHVFGDQVLLDIADTLQLALENEDDLLGRLGGDEFILFLRHHSSMLALKEKADEICRSLKKCFEQGVEISGSLGIAVAPDEGDTFVSLYQKADIALYQAKKYGRNQAVFYQAQENQEGETAFVEEHSRELAQKENLKWNTLEKRIFAYYYLAFTGLYDELFVLNLTQGSYQMVYHVPNKYNIPAEKGSLTALLSRVLIKDVYPEDKQKFINFFKFVKCKEDSCKGIVEEEFRKYQRNGEYRWITISLIPVEGENDDQIVLLCNKDISEKKEAEKRALRNYKDQDQLTGFSSFEYFRVECEQLLLNRGVKKYALWYCDLKNFKFINDIYGYEFGDRVLQYWAKIIGDETKDGDTFARKSADHFMILCQFEELGELAQVFFRQVNLLKNYKEFIAKRFQIDMSAGVYLIEKDEDVLFMEDMIDKAKIAQRKAKLKGGSRFTVYTEDMRNKIIREKEMEADMQYALTRREFRLYFQPQVAISGQPRIVSAEALVRWVRDDGTIVPPGEFIPLFEKNGFIVKLDRFVFEDVCRHLSERLEKGDPVFKIAVNVSRISAFQADFAETYIRIKEHYQIPDGLLEIEFTETVIVENVQHLSKIMKMMRAKGFMFSLDDFGSGYSSLNMLKNIVVDVLKLDMMFFQNSVDIDREQIIVASVIHMAKALEMKIVSEGVETEEQLKRLKNLGCDIVQGYYFGKAVPKEEFASIYRELLLGKPDC